MKAAVIDEHGGREVLRLADLPDPECPAGHVLVRVQACALNQLDVWVRKGLPHLHLKFPHIMGSDAAGTVAAVADDVTAFAVGDAVIVQPGRSCGACRACLAGQDNLCRHYGLLGEPFPGACCELLAVPESCLVRKPAEISFAEAAAIPVVMLTAWHMLAVRAAVRPGEWVLVQAGGSGVGSAGIQIAKLLGARVIATAGSDEKCAQAWAMGADNVINYNTADFAAEVKNITGRTGVDVVFEHVGAAVWEKSLASLRWGGRLVTCGSTTGFDARLDLRHLFFKQLSLLGSTMGSRAELHDIVALVEQRRLKPVVHKVLPMAEVAEGHRMLEDRQAFGKVVLKVGTLD